MDVAVVQLEVAAVVVVEVVVDVEDMAVVVIKWTTLYQMIHQKEAEDFMVAQEVEEVAAEVVVVVEMIVDLPQTVEEMTV